MSTTRKSVRRHRAAESLVEHFEDNSSHDDFGYDDDKGAESWSSHDISAGAAPSSKKSSRRSSATSSRSKMSNSSSRRDGSSRRATSSRSDGRPRSPSSLKSDRSGRSHSSRQQPESPYKSMSKNFGDEVSGTPSRRSKKSTHSSGIPKSPGMISPSAKKAMKDSSSVSSSSSRRRASAKEEGGDKLARILELGNQWKNMKQQHEIAAQQATNRRVDLTKEIF